MRCSPFVFGLLSLVSTTFALDNGLALTPQMGYSSWNDCGSVVTEEHIKATANYFVSSGLAAKGYNYINVDEGWLLGRDPVTLKMVEDKNFFPSGMKGLGEFVHNLVVKGKGKIMKYGLYTSRGVQQCDTAEYKLRCMHNPPNPVERCEGTHGYEAIDAQWLVDAGADYIKEDSCGGNQTHSVAFSDYGKMRDALNKSGTAAGRPIFFSLCGWETWYAPPDPSVKYGGGHTLGNSYRIHGDGDSWGHLSGCTNTIAAIGKYSRPGAWADPDLLIGPETKQPMHVGGQSDEQGRTQFNLWSTFPAPLLISQNVLTWSKYALETYSNEAIIAINQDPVTVPGARLVGGDLVFPCDATQQCKPENATNVWGRTLSNGDAALVFVNNNEGTATIECDAACLKMVGVKGDSKARDLWTNASTTVVASTGFKVVVPGNGSSRIFRLATAPHPPSPPPAPSKCDAVPAADRAGCSTPGVERPDAATCKAAGCCYDAESMPNCWRKRVTATVADPALGCVSLSRDDHGRACNADKSCHWCADNYVQCQPKGTQCAPHA